jgi:hypothetical protein
VRFWITYMQSLAVRLAAHVVLALTGAAARLIGTQRDLVHAPLDAEEAEALGVPQGSASPWPQIDVEPGVSAWRVDCWLDEDEGPVGCCRFQRHLVKV